MLIIPDIYEKIASVLADLRPTVGESTFGADDVYDAYARRFPRDLHVMEQRQVAAPSSHSLRGYLNGMLYEYAQQTGVGDPDKPAIEVVSEMEYRFAKRK